MKKYIYLSEAENTAIELLAKGERLKIIREACRIPSNRFPFFLAEIRRKTGIEDVQNVKECAHFWKEVQRLQREAAITEQESRLLKAFTELKSIPYEGKMLGLSAEEAIASFTNALRKCGIFAKDDRTQRIQTRFFFAIHGIPHSKLPRLSPEHWNVLRVLASGGRLEHVQDLWTPPKKAKYAREYIREACERIGANSPGRGTRRNIICAFLEAFAMREKEKSQKPSRLDSSEITPEQYSAFFWRKLGITLEGLASDIGCSLEEAVEAGMKMCKRRPGCDCSEKAILECSPSVPAEPSVSMDDPSF